MTIALKIKQLRNGISQTAFGKQIWPDETDAAAQGLVKRIEAGQRDLTGSELKKISQLFHVSLYDLLDIEAAPSGFTLIPKYKARLSGGPGTYVLSEDIEREFAFRTDWIKRKASITSCALFEVEGDSMFPLISNGDIVLVDRAIRRLADVIDRKIYAYSEEDRIKVKRLERRGLNWFSISESGESYKIEFDAESYGLIGRVIWVGHELI